jgi:class 3 adenylate cyclase
MKDLERPERIYQVLAEGLAEDFPPIKTVTEAARKSDVPTGTVSFVSTDMAGSTQLLRRGGEHYAGVMEEHDRLLRNEFEKDGYVVDVVADTFLVAFTRPRDAVHAAATAQQALASGDWPQGEQPEVNIGIHTGSAVRTGSRYSSLALIRAVQVCAAAAGGQVLLSQATESLLEVDDLAGLRLRDAGVRELREFDRPVRLYEVVPDSTHHP